MTDQAPPPAFSFVPRPIRARNVPPPVAPLGSWKERPRVPRIGAPPVLVEAGAPGAREEVRAYAERIRQAWAAFWSADVRPWAQKHFDIDPAVDIDPTKIVLGDVLGSDPAKVAAQKKRIALFDRLVKDRNAFEVYRQALQGFDIGGPSPSQAWQALQLHEAALKADRASLASDGQKLTTPDVVLEEPGGVEGGSDSISGAAKTVGTALVALGGLYVIGKVVSK